MSGKGKATQVYEYPFRPHEKWTHQSVTIGADAYSPALPPGTECILVQAVGDEVRMTLDGTAPTGAVGFRLLLTDPPIRIAITDKTNPQFFGEGATSALELCAGE